MKPVIERMRSCEQYSWNEEEALKSAIRAKELCAKLQTVSCFDDNYRPLIRQLVPGIPDSSAIIPPFHCDHGHGIVVGENVCVNYNCTFLDGGYIRLGNNVLIGPGCQLVTPSHPTDYIERRKPVETCYPITIGDDTWLGAGVTVCPGVTIGKRCIIGAGSVVVKDIPDDCLAAGNPATVKRRLNSDAKDAE